MSKRELDRSAVMARVKSGSISLTEAKRLYSRYKAGGASGLVQLDGSFHDWARSVAWMAMRSALRADSLSDR